MEENTELPVKLNWRRRQLIKHALKNEPRAEIAEAIGYKNRASAQTALNNVRGNLIKALNRSGITDQVLVDDYLIPLANANQELVASFEGKFTDRTEVRDNQVRLAALREIFKIKGAYPKEQSENGHISISINNVAITGE